MSVTEVTSQGWGGRLIEAIKGVLVGVVFVLGSFVLLFWNEGRAIKTARSLEEGKAAVVDVKPDKVESANEKKLVHVTGLATTDEKLKDDDFAIEVQAIKLARNVEMYQWHENKRSESHKKLGGGEETVTTYTYDKRWSSDVEKSDAFKEGGHNNPATMPFDSKKFTAKKVALGGFTLSSGLVGKIDAFEPLKVGEEVKNGLPTDAKEMLGTQQLKITDGGFYIGCERGKPAAPGSPQVGDLRVGFKAVKPLTVSVVSQQIGDTFQPFPTSQEGYPVELLETGTKGADAMFAAAESENTMITWLLRFVGWLVMAIGIGLIFNPIAVFGDVIPIVGSFLGAGIGLFAIVASAGLSLFTIAVAWFFYRPVLAIVLFVLAGAALFGLRTLAAKARAAKAGGAA